MFAFGVDLDLIEKNTFDRLKVLVVDGTPSVKRRAFTDEEIARIFSAPLFKGFDPSSTRFRELPGTMIKRDGKYWLPILSLFHGGRLTEFAAMPLADLKKSPKGTWHFDLTEREVKNESSKRQIPLHPHMLKIGFLDYVADLRAKGAAWLFPDLDHESRHGPGHQFSKWWGGWMDKHGLSDPAISHHSWRHTWKRRARASSVKEEMHDVISGHKGLASVSRTYGEGADIEDLARDMALIEFPAFPVLPAAA
jgi:integrase